MSVVSSTPQRAPSRRYPFRRTVTALEAFVGLSALAGAVMLVTGWFAPDVAALEPLGLGSWVLPGLWLFASVAVPSSVAAWSTFRRRRSAPTAVLVASALLLVELAVQIPFVGLDPLQPTMAAFALVLAALAWRARRSGWGAPRG